MGYETSLQLIDVKIKPKSLALVSRALENRTGRGLVRLRPFLEVAIINRDGFLAFRANDDGFDPYEPDEDGTVPSMSGKWYDAERIARWLRRHSEKDGRMILFSNEADGLAWGWEFDGKGRMRHLDLVPIGKWV